MVDYLGGLAEPLSIQEYNWGSFSTALISVGKEKKLLAILLRQSSFYSH